MAKKIITGSVIIILLIGVVLFVVLPRFQTPEVPEPKIVTADPQTERILNTGKVIGFVDKHESHAWLGIPFAKPPVGELRWKAPRPPESWTEPFQALHVGDMCTQSPSQLTTGLIKEGNLVAGNEDCLYLNVWAPPYSPDNVPSDADRLPVMFWIHGGGNSLGFGGRANFNGSTMATTHKVIVVTINYRLGPFGWFTHPALREFDGNEEDNSGNYGNLDIIRALTWVRNNIAAFGGNPDNVTIYGESAGATNVLSMMLSPKAKGLFHRAISQSGGIWTLPISAAENYKDAPLPGHPYSSREIINLSLIRDGIVKTREEAIAYQNQMTHAEIAAYLYGKSNVDIITLYPDRNMGMLSFPDTFTDGTVLPYESIDTIFTDANLYNSVPVILGTNRDEEKLFMVRNPQYQKRVLWLFTRLIDPKSYERRARYLTDSWKANGVDYPATLIRESQGPSVFAYRFDWDEEPSAMGYDLSVALGAAHGLDNAFVFHNFINMTIYTKDNAEGRNSLSRSMMSYWAEFAYAGNPGRGRNGNDVLWKPWDNTSKDSDKFIIFDTPEDKGIRMASGVIIMEEIKARLLADNSFATQEEYCKMYVELFKNHPLWDQAEYESLGKEGCKAFNPESFIN